MSKKDLLLNQKDLLEKFQYLDGKLLIKKCYRKNKIGSEAGHCGNNGYWVVNFNDDQYLAHRIIFFIHHGYLPELIDHIDRDKLNNRIENLRECTRSQNALNKNLHKNADTKYYGLIFMNYNKQPKYIVKIRINGKVRFFGSYISEIEAVLVYNREAVRHHGEFANLNIIYGV